MIKRNQQEEEPQPTTGRESIVSNLKDVLGIPNNREFAKRVGRSYHHINHCTSPKDSATYETLQNMMGFCKKLDVEAIAFTRHPMDDRPVLETGDGFFIRFLDWPETGKWTKKPWKRRN